MKSLVVLAVLAACAALGNHQLPSADAPPATDAPPGCNVFLTFDPPQPVAGPSATARATANVNGALGVLGYSWSVTQNGTVVPYTMAQVDNSAIDFPTTTAGVYDVHVDVSSAVQCPSADTPLNVAAPNANVANYRLRVVAPPTVAPPQELIIQVHGGADYNRNVALDAGVLATGAVQNGPTGVGAYLRFTPVASPYAPIETFSQSNGTFSLTVLPQPHDVLVVPMIAGVAPKLIAQWMVGTTLLAVDPGTTVSGSVLDPAGVALAGAKVQLSINGTPSTLTTTAGDGSFSVLAEPIAGANVTVDVVPPAGRGLPRLDATSTSFDLTRPVAVRYGSNLASCNAGNAFVHRGTTGGPLGNGGLPGATVTIVGTLSAIGTVTAGVASTATGTARIVATADSTGHLPSTLIPSGVTLSAVTQVAPGDVAVTPIGCPTIATIDAPAMIPMSAVVQSSVGTPLAGATIEAVSSGALALAGVPQVATTSDASGRFTIAMASGGAGGGGHYDLHVDNASGRNASTTLLDVTATTVPATIALPKALLVSGIVTVSGNPNPVAGAAVQILCTACAGLDISRPLAETATDDAGQFTIPVLDPGTM